MLVDVERWPETFTPHLKAAHLDGALEVGATGWIRTKLPLPRAPFTVTSVEEGRSWAWRGKLLWQTLASSYRCEPTERGSRVTIDVSLNGPLVSILRPLARSIYRPQMERALDLLVENAQNRS